MNKNAPVTTRELPPDNEIEKVKQSVDATFGLFPYLILYTGCRRGEALALTYEDIDFNKNTISVNKVVVFENGAPKIHHRAKSKSGIRIVPLLIPLKNVLDQNKFASTDCFTFSISLSGGSSLVVTGAFLGILTTVTGFILTKSFNIA